VRRQLALYGGRERLAGPTGATHERARGQVHAEPPAGSARAAWDARVEVSGAEGRGGDQTAAETGEGTLRARGKVAMTRRARVLVGEWTRG